MKKLNKSLQKDNKSYTHSQVIIVCIVFIIIILTIIVCIYTIKNNMEKKPSSNTSGLEEVIESTQEDLTFFEEDVGYRLIALKQEFPDGKYWNHEGIALEEDQESWSYVTDTPCNHSDDGTDSCNIYDGATLALFPEYEHLTQCLGFSSMISDRLFGEDSDITVFQDYDQLRIGDQIRLTVEMHSMIVLSKNEDYITVVEVDEDRQTCQISWGRILYLEELKNYGDEIEYFTRYPAE